MLARRTDRSPAARILPALAVAATVVATLALPGGCAISDEPAFISDEPAFATACEPECHDAAESDCACDVGLGCQDECECDWDCDAPTGFGGGGPPADPPQPDPAEEPAGGRMDNEGGGGDSPGAGEEGEGGEGTEGDQDDPGMTVVPNDGAEGAEGADGCDPDEHSAEGDPTKAEPLTEGQREQRHACAGTDDWYTAAAHQGGALTIRVTAATAPLALRLYDPDGVLMVKAPTDGAGEATMVVRDLRADGAWTLRVRAAVDDAAYDVQFGTEGPG